MGIYDRDYMRRRGKSPVAEVREQLSGNPRWQLFAVLGVVALVIAVVAWPRDRERQFAERYAEEMHAYDYPAFPDPIDINEASFTELMRIPAVDQEIAHGILEKRPFSKVEDLLEVRGIGNGNLTTIRQFVYIDND